jgi:L-ribulose-5-phosphate 3-epimerase
MQIAGYDIGVCSWSIRTQDAADLVQKTRELGLQHVQIALGKLLARQGQDLDNELKSLADSGLILTSGMIGFPGEDYSSIAMIRRTGGYLPDENWPERRELSLRAAELAARMGLSAVSTHVGFIPPSSHERYKVMVERICDIADAFASHGQDLLLETGQESSPELLQFLNDLTCRNVFVNFDPANMILYGAGDPIDSIRILCRHIRHVHVKDAVLSDQPGTKWGQEVPFGQGQVDPRQFLTALKTQGYTGPLVIEREGGSDRMADVRAAITALQEAAGETS